MGAKQAYLLSYNAALCLGWAYVFVTMCRTILGGTTRGKDLQSVWENVEMPLKVVQTTAVMEVIHAAIGLVRSPVMITATQVASRIWVLWGIVCLVPEKTTTSAVTLAVPYTSMSVSLHLVTLLTAWCLSEVIRYGFFALKEAHIQSKICTWLRYSGFIVLYPLGVSSELAMVWLALPVIRAKNIWSISLPNAVNFGFSYYYACILFVALYLPGFPQLYGYMLTQRRRVLGRGVDQRTKKTL